VITNDALTQFPAQLLPLIEQKTGVRSRSHAKSSQCTSDLAIAASSRCLAKANFDPGHLDAIILATSSPDRLQPATASRVQSEIGALNAFAFDINAVCSGGVFALHVADAFIKAGIYKNILVVAAEIYSRFLDPSDFSTYPYFGDGAGAVLLVASESTDKGIVKSLLKTDGSGADIIQVPAGGSMLPFNQLKNPKDLYFKMVGKEVFDFAITRGTEIIQEIIKEAQIDKDQLCFIIPHQANINIIKELSSRLDINFNKFFTNLERYGNTAAASVLISLDELMDSGKIRNNDTVLLVAFGGGFSWGSNLIIM
jgi:3-oxoacyl-[acyl-carrier-protein] synthase-3